MSVRGDQYEAYEKVNEKKMNKIEGTKECWVLGVST
jgi:Holliday junction resolvase-like predicted endonuclease